MHTRRKAAAALLVAISTLGIAPAGAATDSIDDPAGDVSDGTTTSNRPTIDITGLSLENEPDGLVATLEVAEVVPFTDDRWDDFDLLLSVVLADPGDTGDSSSWTWSFGAFDGQAFSSLGSDDGTTGCFTDVAQTATAYVLTADEQCANQLPRTLTYGANAFLIDGDTIHADFAPDETDPLAGPVESGAGADTGRLAGTDRILTAVELSQDAFPGDASAGAVVVAAAMSFPDALAGGPLAFYAGAPMLLTGVDGLDARVQAEMERVLEPGGTVYVLGGTAALSDAVVADVRSAGFDPQRVAGTNRFETAVAIADEIDEVAGGHLSVLLADGRTFPDALIAGAAAPRQLGVVLLTDGTTMPAATDAYLAADESDRIAIGATAGAAASGVRRITGANPSELSVNVAEELAPVRGAVAVASQASFADALAGGPHIARLGGGLLLTDPQTLSTATRDALADASGTLRTVSLYGGTAALSTGVEQAIQAALAS